MRLTTCPDTNHSLLVRIHDPRDRDAWHQFVQIYRPVIYRVGRKYGLQDADVEILVQQVMEKIERATTDWDNDRQQGRFRGWLITVARNTAIDMIRRIRPDVGKGGTSILEQLRVVAERPDVSTWQIRRELEREAFRQAARRIRPEFTDSTWAAFWETMVSGVPCDRIAEQLQISPGAVYTARSRVMKRLRDELEQFDWQDALITAEDASS